VYIYGRVGEFVVDKNGRNISLTALIFGRHHEIFDSADFIQVKQPTAGELMVYVTSNNENLNCVGLFDTEGINMDIVFQVVANPFKTKAGKVPLIIK
jgi:phenylacetate-CoA ligase